MSKHDDGGPAYPGPADYTTNGDPVWNGDRGLSLLDFFAGQALAEVIKGVDRDFRNKSIDSPQHAIEIAASTSYDFAAAMIAEKRRREGGEA